MAQHQEITGAVAYTDILRFDYTKDGVTSQVQFWLEFKGSPALGSPGEAGYTPESGAIFYYLVDRDKKQKVDNWLMGFNMMEGPPPSGPYPITDIVIRGNQATFEAFGLKWTVIDGGEGYSEDTVKINDGFTVREMKMFDGDLKIQNAMSDTTADNKKCIYCHEAPGLKMLAKGGKHSEMGCGECHVGHPPEVVKPYSLCTKCHEPHSNDMSVNDCKSCHQGHTAGEYTYSFDVSSQHCAACHQDAAKVLESNPTKHSGISCVLCHQETHGATVDCRHCHGAPHPKHVMRKTVNCLECHKSAHDLESASAE